jgi:hypothetical protein
MPASSSRASYIWPNWLTLALAVWLFISPWIIAAPAAGTWAWNAWVIGVLVAISSIIALSQVAQWEEWVNLVLGVWLFLSPWILGFTGIASAAEDAFIVGALVVIISIWGIVAARQIVGVPSTQQTQHH